MGLTDHKTKEICGLTGAVVDGLVEFLTVYQTLIAV